MIENYQNFNLNVISAHGVENYVPSVLGKNLFKFKERR